MELKGLKWLLPVLLCMVFSCAKTKRPEGILTREEMINVMMEIYTNEEKVNRLGVPRDSAVKVFDSLKVRLFTRLSIPDSVFKRSLKFYSEHPKEMEFIYTALVDSLQLREQRAPGAVPSP